MGRGTELTLIDHIKDPIIIDKQYTLEMIVRLGGNFEGQKSVNQPK